MPLDAAGKILKAKQLKDEGNAEFKEKNYSRALRSYFHAIAYIRGLPGRPSSIADPMGQMLTNATQNDKMSAEDAGDLDEFECILQTNIAMCHIRLSRGFKAIEAANEALRLKPTSWKAKLRKAEGKLVIQDYEDCLTLLNEVEEVADDSANATIRDLREQCRLGARRTAIAEKQTFSKLFSKLQVDA